MPAKRRCAPSVSMVTSPMRFAAVAASLDTVPKLEPLVLLPPRGVATNSCATVTEKVQLSVFPAASVASQWTRIVPAGKVEPLGGVQPTVAEQLSWTVGL